MRGPGWHRYNGDGYGDRATDGRPWAPSGQGNGHLWPALSASAASTSSSRRRAEAASLLLAMSRFSSGVGLIPEQNSELPDLPASPFGTDPTVASIGFENGGAAGSASPLTWSAASFVRLARDLATGRNVVLPAVTHRATSPTPRAHAADCDEPRRQRVRHLLSGHRHWHDRAGERRLRRRDEHGHKLRGDNGLDDRGRRRLVQRRRPDHGRHQCPERRRRQFERRYRPCAADGPPRRPARNAAPRRRRPGRRQRRPGNYAYPTFAGFPPGAFESSGSRSSIPATPSPSGWDPRPVRDVRQPARRAARRRLCTRPWAATTSTAAAHPLRNFAIAPAFA